MKHCRAFLMAALMLFCGAVADEVQIPVFEWERDGAEHWQADAAGAEINRGAHEMGGDPFCTVCGSSVIDWGDGYVDVSDYDDAGNCLRSTSFENGVIIYESIHALTYDENGMVLTDVEYINGLLYGESHFAVNDDGEHVPVSMKNWHDDGTTSVNTYDEHGNCVHVAVYDEHGSLTFETVSKFAQDDYGWYYECSTTSRFDTGECFHFETNRYGDTVRSQNSYADGTLWCDSVYEYEYDKSGVKVWRKHYSFGTLAGESFYNSDGMIVREIEYMEDGGSVVCTYDENGELVESVSYAADGSVIGGM